MGPDKIIYAKIFGKLSNSFKFFIYEARVRLLNQTLASLCIKNVYFTTVASSSIDNPAKRPFTSIIVVACFILFFTIQS